MDLYGFKFQEFKLIQQIEANKCYWKINLLPEKCISTLRFWCCNYFIAWFRVNSLNNQCAIICVDCSTILRMIVLTTISLNFRFCFVFTQATENTANVLMAAGYTCESRGPIYVKGKGTLTTYFVRTPFDDKL